MLALGVEVACGVGGCGLEAPDVLLAYWWVRPVTDMAGGSNWDSPERCWPAGELGLIPGWLAEGFLRAGIGMLVGGAWTRAVLELVLVTGGQSSVLGSLGAKP